MQPFLTGGMDWRRQGKLLLEMTVSWVEMAGDPGRLHEYLVTGITWDRNHLKVNREVVEW